MRVETTHHFPMNLARLVNLQLGEAYAQYLTAHHPLFEQVTVLDLRRSGHAVTRKVRYALVPIFDKLGPVKVSRDWFMFTEYSRFDFRTGVLAFRQVPALEHVRQKILQRGQMVFDATATGAVRRSTFEVEFDVAPLYRPFVALAAQLVAGRIRQSLDAEADLLKAFAAEDRSVVNVPAAATAALS